MTINIKKEWFKGGDCVYTPNRELELMEDDVKIVLAGRTWIVRPQVE